MLGVSGNMIRLKDLMKNIFDNIENVAFTLEVHLLYHVEEDLGNVLNLNDLSTSLFEQWSVNFKNFISNYI